MSLGARLQALMSQDRGVLAALSTGLLVRSVGIMTTLLAMPLAYQALGEARFGAFLTLVGIANWLGLSTGGIQQAIGRKIAADDLSKGQISNLLGSIFVVAMAMSSFGTLVFAGFIWFAAEHAADRFGLSLMELRRAGLILVGLIYLQILMQVFEGVNIGELKVHNANLARLVGSGFSFVCLLILPVYWPDIAAFVIALNGGLLLGAIINASQIYLRVRPRIWFQNENWPEIRLTLLSGFAFFLTAIASLVHTTWPVILVSANAGPEAAVEVGLYLRLLVFCLGLAVMVTGPLWPALINARLQGDLQWVQQARTIVFVIVVGGAFTASLVIALGGPWLLKIWTGFEAQNSVLFTALMGLVFFQVGWANYWCSILMSYKREVLVARIFIIEAGAIIITSFVALNTWEITAMMGAICLSMVMGSTFWMPFFAWRISRRGI